ncbi:AAA family ATPase [Clostridiales bacterium FE2010]|nr:AAA family ATPase [Clostridiales bacterium FE2010]
MAENIIYYGPPGTGKTYLLQNMMCDYIDYEVSDQQIKNAYIQNTKDWILIAMVLLQNHGKMRPTEIQQKIDSLSLGRRVSVLSVLEQHNMDVSALGVTRTPPCVFFECAGGTWYVNHIRIQQDMPDFFKRFLNQSKVDRRYAFVSFHQSFSYEDFIEGIRPEYVKETNSIDYSPKPGIFKALCKEAEQHPEKEYAIFIDEINRGNISEIFGELISLIEIDKRKGMANELSTILPYSKEPFIIPSNVNLFGTMNSADRSVGAIDIALRRRFKFIPMTPDSKIIADELLRNRVNPEDIDGINVIKLFNTMNSRIELLLDRNHMLGQALFMSVRKSADIITIMKDKIVPLLEEYFFNDLQKIQLVFNDLDESGDLRDNPIYMHSTLSVDDYFNYIGDYLLDDKKHYYVNPHMNENSIIHVYSE